MLKSALTLAVLAMANGLASAQSSVTVYGRIDLGLVLDSGNPAGKSVRISSGAGSASRLGFKGTEDLGDGYKAGFQLETGFCADSAAGAPNFCTGSNNFMGRQAHVDLSAPIGTLIVGRQYSLGFWNLIAIDPFTTGYAGRINNTVDGSGTYLNNSARYTTPVLGGVTASLEGALGEQVGNWRGNREVGGNVTYAAGPVVAEATVYDVRNANGVGTARKDVQVGATYNFDIVKIHGLIQKSDGQPTTGARIDALDFMLGATIPALGGNFLTSYVHHHDQTSLQHTASQVGAGYNYPLSKRTSVYTAFAKIQNRNGASFTVGNSTEAGTGDKSFNLGVIHNF